MSAGLVPVVPVAFDLAGASTASGLSIRTLQDAISTGALIAHYQGRKPVVLARDLEDYVAALPTERAS